MATDSKHVVSQDFSMWWTAPAEGDSLVACEARHENTMTTRNAQTGAEVWPEPGLGAVGCRRQPPPLTWCRTAHANSRRGEHGN